MIFDTDNLIKFVWHENSRGDEVSENYCGVWTIYENRLGEWTLDSGEGVSTHKSKQCARMAAQKECVDRIATLFAKPY